MHPADPLRPAGALRRALLGLLVLGLLLQAQAGVLRQLLGAAHWHRPAAVLQAPARTDGAGGGDGWLQRLQAWRYERMTRSPLVVGHRLLPRHEAAEAALHVHPSGDTHHHDRWDRHHHAPHDGSVVALGAGDGEGPGDGQSGSLLQPLALTDGVAWRVADVGTDPWPGDQAPAWRDAGRRQPDRPPRG